MRQDVHPSIRRPSVLQFFLSLLPRPRENLFRSSHSLCGGGGHFLCANYFPFGITSPSFNPFPDCTTDIPPRWNCFSRPSSRSMRADRSAIYRGATRVPVGLAPLLIPRGEGGSLRGGGEEEEIDETN